MGYYYFKMKICLGIVALALLAMVHSQTNTISVTFAQRPFSGIFAATWLGGFCLKKGNCDDVQYSMWDRQSFTIHGFWPGSKTDRSYSNFAHDNVKNNSELYDDMRNYWPAQSNSGKSEDWLWNHEYNKHGKDYSHILQIHDPANYAKATSSELQQSYFQAGIDFYKLKSHKLDKLNISKASGKVNFTSYRDPIVTKKQLAEIIGIEDEAFLVSCKDKKDYLVEIQICVRIQKNLDVTYENCKAIKVNKESPFNMVDTCHQKIILFDLKKSGTPSQHEVTRYPEAKSEHEL